MNIRDMVADQLRAKGCTLLAYDGFECSCRIDDLMPCGQPNEMECEAAIEVPCPNPGDDGKCECDGGPHDWHGKLYEEKQ